MAPNAKKRPKRVRQPLATTTVSCDTTQLPVDLVEIFSNSQHVTTSDLALTQLKKLYKNTEFHQFETPFKGCVKKLLQSKQTIYFKTSCEFLCKFLQHVSKLSDEIKAQQLGSATLENTAPGPASRRATRSSFGKTENSNTHVVKKTRQASNKRGTKRKSDVSDDELVMDFTSATDVSMQTDSATEEDSLIAETSLKRRKSTAGSQISIAPITDHDRLVSTCIDIADHYMQVANEECRLNAVYFICKFLSYVESLDEEICDALKSTLPKRIRDRKPMIRAQAVLASRTFQDNKLTQDGFRHHFYRDPELVVRKALLQIMDTKIFGYEFLVDSTQDAHESMRKAAFQRLAKISPHELDTDQLHRIIHNGLNERERQASYSFKNHTLESWLSVIYNDLDLHSMLNLFDVTDNYEDVCRLLELIYERDLEKLENNGTATKLHHVVESFRERWLNTDNNCLPLVGQLDENVTIIWFTLIRFCKKNQSVIKPVKVRIIDLEGGRQNESMEMILDSQERNDDIVDLYDRLTPDLVNLVDFLKRFVYHANQATIDNETKTNKLEFIYQQLMQFITTYEIGDELERKTVQEAFSIILKENLLTGKFANFIPPIITSLFQLIYSSSSNLMINYISELINNVRSHLEDLATSTQSQIIPSAHSAIAMPTTTPKKARISSKTKRTSRAQELDQQDIEFKVATIRVELAELADKLESCIKEKDFDAAKLINNKIVDLKNEQKILHDRRCSIASDVSHMSMVIETETNIASKFSSTMIGDTSMNESFSSSQVKDDLKIFKNHTNELIKCLQMYFGCLQNVKISQVPQTMLNHLNHLSYECLDEWFKENSKVRSLMVACNGLTALVDKDFAKQPTTLLLLVSACQDQTSIDIRTVGFRSLVDVLCQHEDIDVPDEIEKILNKSLRDYGKYSHNDVKKNELDHITALIEGTTKLFYYQKISSPRIMSHLILWWYHPYTRSKLKQFIGVFLPAFVADKSRKKSTSEDTWLKDVLGETFILSIEYLHSYILGPGFNIMAASDMHSLINFLSNLIPVSFHADILDRLDDRIDELSKSNPDLLKYLKQSKNSLASIATVNTGQTPLARPLENLFE